MFIRKANENDIPKMIDLLLQVGSVHHEIRPDLFREGAQKYDADALKAILSDPDRPIFCADKDGTMLGYAFCVMQITRGNPVLCDRKVLYIDDLCVDSDLRGQNIAKTIYDAVVEYARKSGCDAVTLNVWAGNDRALRFYEKCGLKPQKYGLEFIL